MNSETPISGSRRAPRQPKTNNTRRRVRSESDRKKHAGWRKCPRCNRLVSTNGRNFYHHMHKCDRVFFADMIAKVDTARTPVSTPLPPPTPKPDIRRKGPVRMSEMQKVVFLQQLCFLRVYDRTVDTVLKQLEASHVSLFSTAIFDAVRSAKDADAVATASQQHHLQQHGICTPASLSDPPRHPPPARTQPPPLPRPHLSTPTASLSLHLPPSSYAFPTPRSSPSPTSVHMPSLPALSFPHDGTPPPGTPMSITNSHAPYSPPALTSLSPDVAAGSRKPVTSPAATVHSTARASVTPQAYRWSSMPFSSPQPPSPSPAVYAPSPSAANKAALPPVSKVASAMSISSVINS